MFEDEDRSKPKSHEVGMPLDTMGLEELNHRIVLLQAEIARLEAAIKARQNTRAAADSVFKF